jgi:hypothetical protein
VRGGALPPALLLAALGLSLGCAERGSIARGLLALIAGMGIATLLPLSRDGLEGIFLGCWVSVVATAASVYLVRGPNAWIALALSLNAGIWTSAVVHLAGRPLDLIKALPCILILFPVAWLVRRNTPIPIRVVSSWIIAIATLAAVLQLLPVTPGYLPDHLE